MLLFVLPETSSANILYRRARRLRKITGNPQLKALSEIASEAMTRNEIIQMTLVRPFTLSFSEPMVFLLNLYIALIYGLLYVWFESFPVVFMGIYKFNLSEEGLSFIGILLGAAITIPPFFGYLYKKIEPKFNENGELRPEERLPPVSYYVASKVGLLRVFLRHLWAPLPYLFAFSYSGGVRDPRFIGLSPSLAQASFPLALYFSSILFSTILVMPIQTTPLPYSLVTIFSVRLLARGFRCLQMLCINALV